MGASRYESVILHSCYGVLVSSVSELIFATRSPHVDDDAVNRMIELVQRQGVPIKASNLKRVDHTKCPPNDSLLPKSIFVWMVRDATVCVIHLIRILKIVRCRPL